MQTTLKNEFLEVKINHLGAELSALIKEEENLIWTIDEKYWNKTSPVLFPIVGRLKNDSYTLNGQQFEMLRHGFARNYNFELLSKTASEAIFLLKHSPETLKIYPFAFEFQIQYTLKPNLLEVKYSVFNTSDENMPFSVGAHPALNIKGNIEGYDILFEDAANDLLTYTIESDLFSGETEVLPLQKGLLNLNYELFRHDALVFKNYAVKALTLFHKKKPLLSLRLPDFPFLGIWTKRNAPFLCLEPWCGVADKADHSGNFLEKEGINILAPNAKFEAAFEIEVH